MAAAAGKKSKCSTAQQEPVAIFTIQKQLGLMRKSCNITPSSSSPPHKRVEKSGQKRKLARQEKGVGGGGGNSLDLPTPTPREKKMQMNNNCFPFHAPFP